jgi:3',5'-cyclic AMP phosphodiesterase CpdA
MRLPLSFENCAPTGLREITTSMAASIERENQAQSTMLICQISDLHIKTPGKLSYRVVDTSGMMKRCVDHIVALKQKPDIVIATGDLTDFGRPDEYAHLRELLAPLSMPVYLIPGNHDHRENMVAAFPDHLYLTQALPFIQYAIDDLPVRILAIDTVIPGASGGELCDIRLAWLTQKLDEAPARPTLIIMHHPPFRTFIGHMDDIGLANAERLKAIVRRHPQIERILCGHLHRSIQVRWAGTLASTSLSPAHQVALDLVPDAPSQFVMEPPAYQLHKWHPDTGLVSHTAFIGKFAGPYPFYDGGGLID